MSPIQRPEICGRCGEPRFCHHMGDQEHLFEPEILDVSAEELAQDHTAQIEEDKREESAERMRGIVAAKFTAHNAQPDDP